MAKQLKTQNEDKTVILDDGVQPIMASAPGATVMGQEELNEVTEVIKARSPFRYYGLDLQHKVDKLEQEFSEKMGTRHALAVSSGTAALKVALLAAGVGPGDEVIIPAYTFIATANVVVCCGAIPVLAEINDTLMMDPDNIEKKITPRTRAIIPVHMTGVAAEIDRICEVAARHGLAVIEDCAQSCGASLAGKRIGAWGDFGAFSFQQNKIMTTGDGGMITTNDDNLFERATMAHDQGALRRPDGKFDSFFGEVYRMNEMTGAVGLAQLRKLDDKVIAPMRRAKYAIKDALSNIPGLRFRRVPDPKGDVGVTLSFIARDKQQAALWHQGLLKLGIPGGHCLYGGPLCYGEKFLKMTSVFRDGFPFNLPAYKDKVLYTRDMMPRTADFADRHVFIRTSPVYTEKEISRIIDACRQVLSK